MGTHSFNPSKSYAEELDRNDPLGRFRQEFYLPEGRIYLDGNSLGLLSWRAERSLQQVIAAWRDLGIDGWTEGEQPWFDLSERLGAMMAPLVGADPEEVIVTGSTTVTCISWSPPFTIPGGSEQKSWRTSSISPPTSMPCKASCASAGWIRRNT